MWAEKSMGHFWKLWIFWVSLSPPPLSSHTHTTHTHTHTSTHTHTHTSHTHTYRELALKVTQKTVVAFASKHVHLSLLSIVQIRVWSICAEESRTDSLAPPVNVSIRDLKANSAAVTWDIPDGEPVIGFAITQQKKDVRMLRFIQEVNTTTRSCALWDLEADTDYIVHVQSISVRGTSPASEPIHFRTPKEAEKQASKSKDEVTMEEVGQTTQLRAGELIIIVVVLIMWAGVIALFCRQYDIIKDNEPNNNKDKAKNSSECSTPEHPSGGLLRSKQQQQQFHKNPTVGRLSPSVTIIEV
uniref:Fibronectin type III domain containing 5 n=1 Tax=Astyanax mexicanus TaxID=7994 RepID=A0A3B1KJ67_ASTMX